VRIYQRDLLGTTVQATAAVSGFNLGAVVGVAVCGRVSETGAGLRAHYPIIGHSQ
jgi:hypothetical protein